MGQMAPIISFLYAYNSYYMAYLSRNMEAPNGDFVWQKEPPWAAALGSILFGDAERRQDTGFGSIGNSKYKIFMGQMAPVK